MARGRKTDQERITIALRREKAFDLRLEGKGYRDIARELGVTVSTAWADVQGALEETATLDQDKVKTLRELELARLDKLYNGFWTKAKDGDAAAANIVLRVSQRRAALLGLDKPVEVNLNQNSNVGHNWTAFQTVVLEVLRGYPEARTALAARLAELNPLEGEVISGGN